MLERLMKAFEPAVDRLWRLRTASLAFLLSAITLTSSGVAWPAEGGNPHWRKNACETCHTAAQPAAGQPALKAATTEALCQECHDARAAPACRHRSGITPAADRVADFDEPLQAALDGGKVTCTTCHDMAPHCAVDTKQRYRNASFLRGGPFDDRSSQCFGCHSKSGYRQSTPHMHVRKGEIQEDKCAFCHNSVPQAGEGGQWQPVTFGTEGALSKLCNGCHMIGPHPSASVTGKTGWMHMVVPPPDYRERMQQSVAERGGSLPLDPNTGEITCATCHNPHHRGLEGYAISADKAKDKLRYENICEMCHEK